MAQLEWMPALSVGNATIDDQHRRLFDLINSVDAAGSSAVDREVLVGIHKELEDYVRVHFDYEERLFAERGYADAASHIKEHQAFVAKIASYPEVFAGAGSPDEARAAARELASFLRSWLSNHIALSDRKYRPWLADKAAR
jgi:methyl-accepting chemotaxis protein/hemerythrin